MPDGAENSTRAAVHTVIIQTTQMAALAEFYRYGLQLNPPAAHSDNHLGFAFDNLYLGIDQVDVVAGQQPGAISLWFEVDDLNDTFQRFVELGAPVRYEPTRKPWGAELASVYDLDGNILGLAQRGTNPT